MLAIENEPEGIVGNLYGIEIMHQNFVGDDRTHTEDNCWCWEEFDFGDESNG